MSLSRREALTLLGAAALLPACGSGRHEDPPQCGGTLTETQQQSRAALAYVDTAPDPSRACDLCQQYVLPPDGAHCGGCKLLPGPVRARGTCRAFTPRG